MEFDFNYVIEEAKKYQKLFKEAKTVAERAMILKAYAEKQAANSQSANQIGQFFVEAAIRNINKS